jgi:23S rRNA pseudouridine1911/1915/1917 synthase
VPSPKTIFENKEYLVLDKPPGWVVNDSQTTQGQATVQSWLAQHVKSAISQSREYRSGIVHRLDKETSGLLLVAKTPKSYEALQKEFHDRQVKKEYLALVHGRLEPEKGEISVPVGRLPWNRERFGILPGGRPSRTSYQVQKMYQKNSGAYTLVALKPVTGRTHQIRIHLHHLGHPLVADSFYAGRKRAKKDRLWCPRLFLHASKISFHDPTTKQILVFESSLPDDLASALYTLSPLA